MDQGGGVTNGEPGEKDALGKDDVKRSCCCLCAGKAARQVKVLMAELED